MSADASRSDPVDALAAARSGDDSAFAALAEVHRGELRVHCYRMLGSYEDAEDLVQEVLVRAWRKRTTFAGRSSLRAWLYRIATHACLDFIDRRKRRPMTYAPGARHGSAAIAAPARLPWLEPFPDALLDLAGPSDAEPEAIVETRETIGLAFLVAVQVLPPRQRAVLLLRDVLGWSTAEVATLLDATEAAVKSALQRAHATIKEHLPAQRTAWTAITRPTEEEEALVRRFIDASERADIEALTAMLHEDAWQTMPPFDEWFAGRDALVGMWTAAMVGPQAMGDWRLLPAHANRSPAVANYLRPHGASEFEASNLDVLRIERGRIVELVTFEGRLFEAFGLPTRLPG